jgi:hypothetical protein
MIRILNCGSVLIYSLREDGTLSYLMIEGNPILTMSGNTYLLSQILLLILNTIAPLSMIWLEIGLPIVIAIFAVEHSA